MCHLMIYTVYTDLVVSAVVILRCVITTPFGRPVDPLELSINAGKSLVCLLFASCFSDGFWVTMDVFPLYRFFCSIFCITAMDVGSKMSSRGLVFFGSDLLIESQTNTFSTLHVSKYCSSLVSHTDIEHITILGCETDNACSHSPGNSSRQDCSFRHKRIYYCLWKYSQKKKIYLVVMKISSFCWMQHIRIGKSVMIVRHLFCMIILELVTQ